MPLSSTERTQRMRKKLQEKQEERERLEQEKKDRYNKQRRQKYQSERVAETLKSLPVGTIADEEPPAPVETPFQLHTRSAVSSGTPLTDKRLDLLTASRERQSANRMQLARLIKENGDNTAREIKENGRHIMDHGDNVGRRLLTVEEREAQDEAESSSDKSM